MGIKNNRINADKLIEMAREINNEEYGTYDWADTFSIMDADDYISSVSPSEILRAVFFGGIEDDVNYTDTQVRYDAYGNLEIVSSSTLEDEAWDLRDEILEEYRRVFGEDKFNEALSEMYTDEE